MDMAAPEVLEDVTQDWAALDYAWLST